MQSPELPDLSDFLLEQIPVRIYFKDVDSRFIRISRTMANYFGLDDPAQAIGKTDFDFFSKEHAFAALIDEQELMRTGQAIVGKEEKETLPDGTVRWALTTKMLLKDIAGKCIGTCGVSKDITEHKVLEDRLFRSQRLESIGTLASGVAHDLNNTLSPILMAVQSLRENQNAEQMEMMISVIEKSAQRGANLVQQILTFARGSADQELEPVQLNSVVREVMEIARKTFPSTIRLTEKIDEKLCPVYATATQMHVVLLNLCVNARDAMCADGGSLSISTENIELGDNYVKMAPKASSGPYALITVRDTGIGIPSQILDRIFDPFFTTKSVGQGTGLGLSTVRGIVENYGGFLSVYSEPGNGTVFRIYLPALLNAAIGLPFVEKREDLLTGNGELILFVDDEPEIRLIAQALLEASGYQVMTAGNGQEALAAYNRPHQTIAAVITDYMMPDLNGIALIRALQEINPKVRVIASSGDLQESKMAELGTLNPSAILLKPYTRNNLLTTVHNVLHDVRAF